MSSNEELPYLLRFFKDPKPPMTEEEEKDHLRKEIVQLKKELDVQRKKISVTAVDLIRFTMENRDKDFLLTQCPRGKTNHYEEQKSSCCSIM